MGLNFSFSVPGRKLKGMELCETELKQLPVLNVLHFLELTEYFQLI